MRQIRDQWETLELLHIETDGRNRSGQPQPSAVSLARQRTDSHRPLADLGLDEFGLFAYSNDEIQSRLDIIDHALDRGDQSDHLKSARNKLADWGQQLQQADHDRRTTDHTGS